MSLYTKGPWITSGPDILAASDRTRIATCGITHNYAANAKLLMAAPDLLEALQAIEKNIWWCNLPEEIRAQARAAMQKAGAGS